MLKTAARIWPLLLIVAFFILAQAHKMATIAPPPEYIWDNVYLWDWARNVSFGNFAPFTIDSHHHMRWGIWGFAAVMIQFFGDEVLIYYLSTAIPSIVAGTIFIYYAWRYIGNWQSAMFALLWYFDSELFRGTFQLLPTGQALLPIAVLLLALTRVVSARQASTALTIVIACTVFWLYGVKETYLAFVPAIAWLLWRVGGLRPLVILSIITSVGYVGETVMFRYMNDDFNLLGRLYALISGGQHVTIMLESAHYVGQQTRYFDSGITMRWVAAVGTSSIVYFPAYMIAVMIMARRSQRGFYTHYLSEEVVALFTLSFIFFTTFFVISISPLRLGHGLVSRYLAISLPFTYLLILSYVSTQLKDAKLTYKIAALLVIPFLVAPAVHRFGDYPKLSVTEISKRYAEFGIEMDRHDCIRGRQKSIVRNQLDMIPVEYRGETVKQMISSPKTIQRDRWFLIKSNLSNCRNTFTITRLEIARF